MPSGIIGVFPDVATIVLRFNDSTCFVVLEIDGVPRRRSQFVQITSRISLQFDVMSPRIPHLDRGSLCEVPSIVRLWKSEPATILEIKIPSVTIPDNLCPVKLGRRLTVPVSCVGVPSSLGNAGKADLAALFQIQELGRA